MSESLRYQCERNVCRNELQRIRMELHNLFPQQNISQSYQRDNDMSFTLYSILEAKLRKCLNETNRPSDEKKSRL